MGFLRSEVDTGHTLANIALASEDEKRSRNARNARAAYDAVLRFVGRVSLSKDENRELDENLGTLKSKLVELGEKID